VARQGFFPEKESRLLSGRQTKRLAWFLSRGLAYLQRSIDPGRGALWFQYVSLVYPAAAEEAMVDHGPGKQENAHYQNR
jgi:hypothetical protein